MKTIFENSDIKVYMNQCDEIFVQNKRPITKNNGEWTHTACLRISTHGDDLQITADGSFRPTSFNGLGGFYVTKK